MKQIKESRIKQQEEKKYSYDISFFFPFLLDSVHQVLTLFTERDTERHRERHRERDTERETQRERHRETQRETESGENSTWIGQQKSQTKESRIKQQEVMIFIEPIWRNRSEPEDLKMPQAS